MTSAASPVTTSQTSTPAPRVNVLDTEGNSQPLSMYWEHEPRGLALVFVRHFGCPFCVLHVRHLKEHHAEFQTAGIGIVVVGNGTPNRARVFSHEMDLPFPVVTDPTGKAYRAFGLQRASRGSMFDPHLIIGGIKAAAQGVFPKRAESDPMQLQGQFLIDANGMIWHADRPARMSDIPSAESLLTTAHSIWD